MGILKTAADAVYTFRFLNLLVTPFNETDAYKAGIIDSDGNRRSDFNMNRMEDRDNYRNYYTTFHRLVFNLKRIMAKAPGGQSVLARYGAALALIKEHGELSDSNLHKIHEKTGIDMVDILAEQSQWYVLPDQTLSPGLYKLTNESVTDSGEQLVKRGDRVRIVAGYNAPVHQVMGINVYEGVHIQSKQRMLITAAELSK